MNVFAYHNSFNGVSWYRVWQPFKFLKRMGLTVRELPKRLDNVDIPIEGKGNVPNAESHEAITKWSDVIFTNFRTHYYDAARVVAQAKFKPLILDIDDDVINIPKWFPTWKDWQATQDEIEEITKWPEEQINLYKRNGWGEIQYEGRRCLMLPGYAKAENVKEQMRAATVVTVSTERLKEVYKDYCKRIEVIPNSVDFEIWPENKRHDDGLIRIGLFGSNSHYRDWKEIAKVL